MKHLRKLLTIIVVLVTLSVSVLFALQNEASVPLSVLVYTFEPQSVALWVLVAFALGGALGMIVSSMILVRTRASLGACKRQLDRAMDELRNLRGTASLADGS